MNKIILVLLTAFLVSYGNTSFAQEQKSEVKTEKADKKKEKKKKKDKKKGKKDSEDAVVINTLQDSASYCMGLLIAQNMKQQGITQLSYEQFVKAMDDMLTGAEQAIPLSESQTIVTNYMLEQKKAQYADKIKAGEDFLAENGKREEVTVLPSGLQYEVIEMGDGAVPTGTSKVRTHYVGTLIDGEVFESSRANGNPVEFPVNGVIAGWTEALKLMPVGSTWKLYIPYDLAYGANPRPGGKIQPYDVLIFEIELISIVQ